jgi:hypothetical protein
LPLTLITSCLIAQINCALAAIAVILGKKDWDGRSRYPGAIDTITRLALHRQSQREGMPHDRKKILKSRQSD